MGAFGVGSEEPLVSCNEQDYRRRRPQRRDRSLGIIASIAVILIFVVGSVTIAVKDASRPKTKQILEPT